MTTPIGRDLERAIKAQKDRDKYTKPRAIFVGDSATKLYDLERRRAAIIRRIAHEWIALTGIDKDTFWTTAIPQVLHDTLEQYEIGAAIIAAEAFLERYGYTITRPTLERTDGNAN